jgi:hypothetical protein
VDWTPLRLIDGANREMVDFHGLVQNKIMRWHNAGKHGVVSGIHALREGCLVPTGHQIASTHCWDGASGAFQGRV